MRGGLEMGIKQDLKEVISFFVFFIPVISIIILIATAIVYCVNTYDCNSYGEVTERETKIVNISCYVKHNDQWYSKDEYKHVRLDNE